MYTLFSHQRATNSYKENYSLKFRLLSCLIAGALLATYASPMQAQTKAVTQQNQATVMGTVVDDKGEPLIGATITQKGTNNKAVTDLDGHFSINAPAGAILIFSYIGTQDKEVKATKNMTVTLSDDVKALNEVVVVGYGTMKKKDLTGSISSVNAKDISDSHTTNLSSALQGTSAGLTVNRNSGTPESQPALQVRGVTTIGDTSPLIIIDGVPGDMNSINPEDVENVSVLKDAASAAIYGSRAAAGVILITTKRAKQDDLQLSYGFEYGISKPTTLPQYVDWKRFMEMTNELRYNDNPSGGKFQTYAENFINTYAQKHTEDPDKYPITNWKDFLYNNHATQQTHTLSLMGGGKKVRSKASFRYDKNNGIYVNRQYERFMTRLNNDFDFNKYLEAHLNANFSYSKLKTPHNNPYQSGGRNIPPIYAVYWQNGLYGDVKDGENIVAKMREGGDVRTNDYLIGAKGEIDIKPLDGLKFSLIASPNFSFNNIKSFEKKIPYTNADDPNKITGYMGGFNTTKLTENRNTNYNITTQFLGNYSKTFGAHSLAVLAGYEYYYMREEKLWGSGDHYELTNFPYLDLAPRDYKNNGGNAIEYSYRSVFGRINYAYNNKYLFEANLRHDGSSRFHKDSRWATFPSVSLGWVISEENFMKNVKVFNHLKLRLSYGKLGNERIGSYDPYVPLYYPYQSAITFGRALLYSGGVPVSVTTAAQDKYAVRNISWETTETFDIGLDARFLHNKLGFTFDYYRKNTRDMLLALQIPIFMGFANPDVNAGKMHTNGWDLELSWRDKIGKLNYRVGFNLADYKSVMGDLNGTEFIGPQINRKGTEFKEWYGYICDGIYQTPEEVANSAKLNKNVTVGDLKYRDISGPNGVPDGVISAEYDRVPLKGSLPHFLYGLTLGGDYSGFDFSIAFQGVGKKWSHKTPVMVEGLANNWLNFPSLIDNNYWSSYKTAEENAKAIYPRLSRSNREANLAMSDFWLFNSWYLRCKNLTVGYTVPAKYTKKAFIGNLRFYVAATDLFSIDNNPKGWDPEVTDEGYPIMRSFIFGVNINF